MSINSKFLFQLLRTYGSIATRYATTENKETIRLISVKNHNEYFVTLSGDTIPSISCHQNLFSATVEFEKLVKELNAKELEN